MRDAPSRSAGSSSRGEQLLGGARVLAVGTEARAGDDEAVEAERRRARAGARRTTSGGPTTANRSTNSGVRARRCARRCCSGARCCRSGGRPRRRPRGRLRPSPAPVEPGIDEKCANAATAAADEPARRVEIGMAPDVHVRAERDRRPDRGRRRPRPCARGRSPTRPDRDRRRPRASPARRRAPRTRSSAGPTPRCRAGPSAGWHAVEPLQPARATVAVDRARSRGTPAGR